MMQILDNPIIWEASRRLLDIYLGLYKKRTDTLRKWGCLQSNPSVLDIGCGIGQYADISNEKYLGVDLNERYIKYARKRHQKSNQSFICTDVVTGLHENSKFDLVLMVDFLHHISNDNVASILTAATDLTKEHMVIFEPCPIQIHPVGKWLINHDRGGYMREPARLKELIENVPGNTIIENISLKLGPTISQAILVVRD
jgi:SAM-dependent methyltransferase